MKIISLAEKEKKKEITKMERDNLFNNEYVWVLRDCDSRVTFTEGEKTELLKIDDFYIKMNKAENELFVAIDIERKKGENETAKQLFKSLSPLYLAEEVKSQELFNIQIGAENRFLNETFNADKRLILDDAKKRIDLCLESFDPLKNSFVKESKNSKEKLKRICSIIWMRCARMHMNYLDGMPEMAFLDEFIAIKAESFIKYPDDVLTELEKIAVRNELKNIDHSKIQLDYETTRHGPMLGTLSALSTKRPNDIVFDSAYKESIFNRDGLSLYADGFINGGDILGTPVLQFIDMLIIEYTANGCRDQTIEFSVSKYMEKRGIKNVEKARKQILDVLRKTYSFSLEYDGKSNKNSVYNMRKTRLITGVDEFKNGNVMVKLNDTFCDALKECPIMKYPGELFTLIETKNPNSYYLLKKITWHKHLNFNHANDDIISVKKLLESCPNLVRYEEIIKVGRIKQRIIKPFERDMNAFSSTLTWEYFKDGKPLTKEEYDQLDYQTFIKLMVHITWINHPSQREKLG